MIPVKDNDYITNPERVNFINWYLIATPSDLTIALRNNSKKFEELMEKYKAEVKLLSLIK